MHAQNFWAYTTTEVVKIENFRYFSYFECEYTLVQHRQGDSNEYAQSRFCSIN